MFVVLGALVVMILLPLFVTDKGADAMLEAAREEFSILPGWAWACLTVATVLLAIQIARMVRDAREALLVVDADGILCRPHKRHGRSFWTRHDWQAPWPAIQRAVVYRPGRRNHSMQSWMTATLVLETDSGEYALGLLHWDPVDEELERPHLTALWPGKKLFELTESHPLIELLGRRGIPVEYPVLGVRARRRMMRAGRAAPVPADGDAPVDLLAYPSLVVMLTIMGAIGVAATVHFMLLPPIRALWPPGYGQILLAGSAVFAVGSMMSTQAPVRERTVVALLLGVMVGGLWHPLKVRALVMARAEAETATYHAVAAGQFRPLDATDPQLDLSDIDIPEYWNSLEPGSEHEFVLHRIDPERYVLSLGELFERTRAFYAVHESD